MNEQELIDLVIVERIDMLLHQKEEERENCESESLFFEEAESILKKLPKKGVGYPKQIHRASRTSDG